VILVLFGLLVFVRVKPEWAAIAVLLGLVVLIALPLFQQYDLQIMIVTK
jgi:hypothetical protein